MPAYAYSFLDTSATLTGPGGDIDLGANAGVSDEGITVEQSEEINKMTIGAGGQGMHSLIANRSARVTVRLLKTSPTNAQLSAMVAFQRTSATNHGQNLIVISNKGLGDRIICDQTAFGKIPAINYKAEGDFVEWEFHSVDSTVALGSGPV